VTADTLKTYTALHHDPRSGTVLEAFELIASVQGKRLQSYIASHPRDREMRAVSRCQLVLMGTRTVRRQGSARPAAFASIPR
jgi:hypothetical protein